jgi:hypothetical protein
MIINATPGIKSRRQTRSQRQAIFRPLSTPPQHTERRTPTARQ